MEQHIPVKLNKHTIKTEFEVFYQSLLKNISHIPENDISLIKTILQSTYDKYSNVFVPHEYRRIVENLSKNDNIVIMKQDKGRGIAIMDKHKYTKKCLEMLNTKQFSKISVDLTKKTEAEIQRVLQKIKSKLTIQEYHRLYSTGSCPGKFYGTAIIHKLKLNDKVGQLPIRTIVPNIVAATYNLARHLTILLSPLSKSPLNIL